MMRFYFIIVLILLSCVRQESTNNAKLASDVTSSKNSGTVCIKQYLDVSSESNLAAENSSEGLEYVKINGVPAKFYTDIYSVRKNVFQKVVSSTSIGCVPKSVLNVGTNTVKVGVIWPEDGSEIVGWGSVKFVFAQSGVTICRLSFSEGSPTTQTCNTTLDFKLKDIDPKLAAEMESIAKQEAAYREQIAQLRGNFSQVQIRAEELKALIERISGLSFDELQESDFAGFEGELAEAFALWQNSKKSVDKLRQENLDKVAQTKKDLEALRSEIDKKLRSEGVELDVIEAETPSLDDINVELPESNTSDNFDESNNIYLSLTQRMIQKVSTEWGASNRYAVLREARAWTLHMEQLRRNLEIGGSTSPRETKAFQNAYAMGRNLLFDSGCGGNGCFTKGMWFKDSPVPENVRSAVDGTLSEIDSERALRLKEALTSWNIKNLGPEEQKVVVMILALKAFSDTMRHYSELQALHKAQTEAMYDNVISCAKTAGRLGVSFIPIAGSMVDLYEIFTGKELLTGREISYQETMWSIVFLGVGTAKHWVKFSESVVNAARVRKATEKLDSVVDSVGKIGLKTAEDMKLLKTELKAATEVAAGAFDASGKMARKGERTVLFQGSTPTCGPTSCGMVLDTFGKKVELDVLLKDFTVGPRGIGIDKVGEVLNRRGVQSEYVRRLKVEDLATHTAKGNPAVVAVKRFEPATGVVQGHAVVVDGITKRYGQEVVAIRDPWGTQYFQKIEDFKAEFLNEGIITKGDIYGN